MRVALLASVPLVFLVCSALACVACESAEETPELTSGCVSGNGAFGARCCGDAGDCGADMSCQKEQCTMPCDGGPECDGLAADGGPRPCSSGFCVPPPLPQGGSGDDQGW